MDFSEIAQPWARAHTNTQALLPKRANQPFYYRHHPKNLVFHTFTVPAKSAKSKPKTVSTWLPHVQAEQVRPGAKGVRQVRGNLGDASSRIGKLQQEGWIILDYNHHSYITTYPAQGGTYHAEKWVNIRNLAGQLIEDFDYQAFTFWRMQLVIDNHLPEPHPVFIERQLLMNKARPARLLQQQHLPHIQARIDAAYQELDDMQASLADIKARGAKAVYEEILTALSPPKADAI